MRIAAEPLRHRVTGEPLPLVKLDVSDPVLRISEARELARQLLNAAEGAA